MALIQEYENLEIEDENEDPYDDEDDYSKQIFTQDRDHSCLYSPRFDRVKVVEDWSRKHMEFHVKYGDDLFEEDTWVSERDFADEAYEELTDWISRSIPTKMYVDIILFKLAGMMFLWTSCLFLQLKSFLPFKPYPHESPPSPYGQT